MDEEYEPIRPKPSDPPPLKRLWKSPEPEESAEVVVPRKKNSKAPTEEDSPSLAEKPKLKKKKKVEEVIDDGTGAVKLEETPVLDTYEARQRARWIISGILSSIALIVLFVILRAFKGNGTEEVVRDGEPTENRVVVDNRGEIEVQAKMILDLAKQSEKLGKTKAAVDQLEKLTKNYQGTAAAREAMHAIDRNKHNRPLFGEDAPELVNGPKPAIPGSANAPAISKENSVPGQASGPNKAADGSSSPPVVAAPPVTKPLPRGYRPKFDFPIDPSGWPTRISCEIDGAELVLVPAATFLMGRDDGEPSESPAHEVFVSTYYIDRNEVTLRQYSQFLKETGRSIDLQRLAPRDASAPPPTDDMPVVNVSWKEAKAYCNWSARRLPTEAQWELAARGLDKRISYWNGELPRKDSPKGGRSMEPVMSLPTDLSPFGAYDMAANAWEWTSEFYDSRYYKQFRNLVSDPTGPKEPPAKIAAQTVKGGSKSGYLTWRDGQKSEMRLPYLGFRGALPVEGAPIAPPPTTLAPSNGPSLPGGVQPF